MENNTLTNLIRWTMEHKRKVAFLSIMTIILILFVNFFWNNAVINVQVSAPFDTKNTLIYAASTGPTQKIGSAGLVIVSRKTTSLIASNGDYIKTESKINIPWYGFMSKKILLKKDNDASKVAYKSTIGARCASYSNEMDQLAYYQCNNPKSLVTYQTSSTGTWKTKSLANLFFSRTRVAPYIGGVIGIGNNYVDDTASASANNITVVNSTGNTTVYNTPESTDRNSFNDAQIFTNTYDPSDKKFVITTSTGDIYIGTPVSNKVVNYRHIQPPSDYKADYNQTLCAFVSDTMYCYRGKNAFGDVPENFDFSKVTGSQIVTYSFASDSETTTKVTNDMYAINDLQVTAKGELYATHYKQLYRFDKKGESFEPVILSQNINAMAGGENLYYIQDKGVYIMADNDKDSSYQVFYSPNIVAKSLYIVKGKVFVIGTTPSDETTTYAYLLKNTEDDSPGKRLIDFFPSALDNFVDIRSSDLIGDQLYFELKLTPYRSDLHPTNIDPGDVALKKVNVLDTLKTLNIPIDEQKIQFVY